MLLCRQVSSEDAENRKFDTGKNFLKKVFPRTPFSKTFIRKAAAALVQKAALTCLKTEKAYLLRRFNSALFICRSETDVEQSGIKKAIRLPGWLFCSLFADMITS